MVVGVAQFPSSFLRSMQSSFATLACSIATLLVGVCCWLKSARILATTKREELSLTRGSLRSSPGFGEHGISGLISRFPLGAWTTARWDMETRHSAAKWSILSLKQPLPLLISDIQNETRQLRRRKVVFRGPLCVASSAEGGGGGSHLSLWSYPPASSITHILWEKRLLHKPAHTSFARITAK